LLLQGEGVSRATERPRFPRGAQGIRWDYRNGSGFERPADSSGRYPANFGSTQSLDALQDGGEQFSGNRDLGHLEDHVPGVRDHLGTDLHQLLAESRRARIIVQCFAALGSAVLVC